MNMTESTIVFETGAGQMLLNANETLRIPAQVGAHYQAAQEDKLANDIVVLRQGDDLVMHYANGAQVIIEDYFAVCEQGTCTVTLPRQGQGQDFQGNELIAQALAKTAADEESAENEAADQTTLVYVEGEPSVVMDMVANDPFLNDTVSAMSLGANAAEVDAASSKSLMWSLLGLGAAYGIYRAIDDGDSVSPPEFEGGAMATATVVENTAAETVVYDANATMAGQTAADQMITYTLKGADAAAFSIDSATGEVRLVDPADFETKASYQVTIVATDAGGVASEQDLSVTVTDVSLTFTQGDSTTASIAENAATDTVVYDAAAKSGDGPADIGITYTLGGTDAAAFTIDSQGQVRLKASADYETKKSYSIDVIATDAAGESATQKVAVAVTDQATTVRGVVVAGPLIKGHGLSAKLYSASGEELGSAVVNDDGTFSFSISDDYRGALLVKVSDSSTGDDYLHEGSGANADLTSDLRGIGYVSGTEGGTLTINVTPLSEIAARGILGDSGGDSGAAPVLKSPVSAEDVAAHNNGVALALGLGDEVNILAHTPVPVNAPAYANADAISQSLGQVLAAIAGIEVSGSSSTSQVLAALTGGIDGGALSQSALTMLLAGAGAADKVAANQGDASDALTAAFKFAAHRIGLSADTGASSSDFLTNTASQTVTGTLGAALESGYALYGSVDGGESWVDITSSVSGTAVSWANVTLSGSSRIVLAVTKDGDNPAADGSNAAGPQITQAYVLDTTGPVFEAKAISVDENATAAGGFGVTDPNGIPATGAYSISGTDAALFTINDAGLLTFVAAKDFEAPGDANADNVYSLNISVTDNAGNTTTEAVTVTVRNVNDAPTGTAVITGHAISGEMLEADTSGIADADGLGAFSYQWYADGVAISGATNKTHTLSGAEVGKVITVTVSYTDGQGTAKAVTSAATASVTNVNSPVSGNVLITGVTKEGEILSADTANLADGDGLGAFSYQWLADGVAIAGATASSYTLTNAEVGKAITVTVSYTDGQGTAESVSSTATAQVANVNDPGSVNIGGNAQEGSTLTTLITDADGVPGSGITYQWQVSTDDGQTFSDVAGANASTFVLGQAEAGKKYRVNVSYTDDGGSAETLQSAVTATVADVEHAGTVSITGTVTEDQTLTAALSDADGVPGSISWQWQVQENGHWVGIVGATSADLTLGDAHVGKAVRAVAQYNDVGSGDPATIISGFTAAVTGVNDDPTGQPTVNGIADLAGSLSVGTDAIADADGLGTFSYQWYKVDGASDTLLVTGLDAAVNGSYVKVSDTSSLTFADEFTPTAQGGTTTLDTTKPAYSMTNSAGETWYIWARQGSGYHHSKAGAHDATSNDVTSLWYWEATGGTFATDADDVGSWSKATTGAGTSGVSPEIQATASVRGVTALSGETAATLDIAAANTAGTLQANDQVFAKVSYTDGQGTQETLASSAQTIQTFDNTGNVAPSVGSPSLTVDEGQTVAVTATDLAVTDSTGPDSASNVQDPARVTIRVSGVTNGQFESTDNTGAAITEFTLKDVNDGKITFVHDGSENTPSFAVEAKDQGATWQPTAGAVLATVTFNAVNDAPQADLNSLVISEGETVLITTSHINITDSDNADSAISITLSNVSNGSFRMGGSTVTSFTMQDIKDGRVSFVHDGSETAPSFDLAASDGAGGSLGASAATIIFTNTNDAPTGSVTISGATTEGSTLTADTSALADVEGLGAFSYQWQAQTAAGNWYDISGATAATFTTTSAESGQAVRVMVSWTDGKGTAESVTSGATAAISGVNDLAQVTSPSMTIVQSGQTVAVSRSDLGVSDSDDADSAVTIQVSGVSNGQFEKSGSVVTEFTLADVANNLITFVHDGSNTAPAFSVAAKDDANGATYGSPVAASISFSASINQQPTLTATGTTQTYTESGAAVAIAPTDFAIDPQDSGDQIRQITLTVTQVADGVDEVLTIDGTRIGLEAGDHTTSNGDTVSVSLGGSTATVTITVASPVSAADAATLVTAITYEHVGNAPSTANDRVISVVVQDDGGTANGGADTSASQTLNTIAVAASNDAPQIVDLDANPTYVEGNASVVIDPDWSIVDAERADTGIYADTTLTIARQGGANSDDVFDIETAVSGLTKGEVASDGSFDVRSGSTVIANVTQANGELVITFTSAASQALTNTLVQAITYQNDNLTPPAVVTLRYTVNDANSGDQGAGGALSTSATVNINITATNSTPELGSTNVSVSLSLAQASAGALIDSDITVTDNDSPDYDGGSLRLSFTAGGTADATLGIDTSGAFSISGSDVSYNGTVIGSIDASNDGAAGNDLLITFNSSASTTEVQALLQSIRFATSAGSPAASRTVQWTLNDGDGGEVTHSQDIFIDQNTPAAGGDLTVAAIDEDGVFAISVDVDLDLDNGSTITQTGTAVTKSGSSGWVSTVSSADKLATDGEFSVTITSRGTQQIGFHDQTTTGQGSQYNLKYAFYGFSNGWLYINENGSRVANQVATYNTGDVLTIRRTGDTITYLKNGSVVYTSTDTSTGDLYAGVNISDASRTFNDVELSVTGFTVSGITLSDVDTNQPTQIRITEVVGGTLTQLDGTAITLGDDGTTLTLSGGSVNLNFKPDANFSGNATFKYVVVDADQPTLVSAESTVTIPVTAVNDAPEAEDNTVNATEDQAYTFALADFKFGDAEGDAATEVTLASLPASGQIQVNGVTVGMGQSIAVSDITAGNVKFIPRADFSGEVSFGFKVKDASDYGSTATLTLNIAQSYDALTASASAVGIDYAATAAVVAADDFAISARDASAGQLVASFAVTITNVRNGSDESFYLNGTRITLLDGQTGTTTNGLTYTTSVNGNDVTITYTNASNRSVANIESYLKAATYQNLAQDIDASQTRGISVTINENSYDLNSGASPASVNLSLATISFNEAPRAHDTKPLSFDATGNGSFTLQFSEVVDTGSVTLDNLQVSNGHTLGTGATLVGEDLVIEVEGLDAAVDGTYSLITTGIPTFSGDFNANGATSAVAAGSKVYKATIGGADWYIWKLDDGAGGGGWTLSQATDTTQWFKEPVGSINDLTDTLSAEVVDNGDNSVTITNNHVGTQWGTSGTFSSEAIADSAAGSVSASGDVRTNHRVMFGLSAANDNEEHYNGIDYALHFNNGNAIVYENGTNRSTSDSNAIISYTADDVFSIARAADGTVTYLKNGAVFYTSSATTTDALFVDNAFLDNGAVLSNVQVKDASGNAVSGVSHTVDVISTTPAASGDGVDIEHNGVHTNWKEGTFSHQSMVGDGHVQGVAGTTKAVSLGLSANNDSRDGYQDSDKGIDFAIQLRYSSGTVYVYEDGSGTEMTAANSATGAQILYSVGDKFRVARDGDQIKYYRMDVDANNGGANGQWDLIYTSSKTVDAKTPLHVDTSFNQVGGKWENVQLVVTSSAQQAVDAAWSQLSGAATTSDSGTAQSGYTTTEYASRYKVTLGTGATVTDGDTLSIAQGQVTDQQGLNAKAGVNFVVPDITPPALASLNALLASDVDNSNGYSQGDTLTLTFSELIKVSDLFSSSTDLSAFGLNFGTGATIAAVNETSDGYAVRFTITLGSSPSAITAGADLSISAGKVSDKAGRNPAANLTTKVPDVVTPDAAAQGSIGVEKTNINVAGVHADIDGQYTLVTNTSSLVFANEFTPGASAGGTDATVVDTSKPVYSYTNAAGDNWYLWARQGSGYHISKAGAHNASTNDVTAMWFWEAKGVGVAISNGADRNTTSSLNTVDGGLDITTSGGSNNWGQRTSRSKQTLDQDGSVSWEAGTDNKYQIFGLWSVDNSVEHQDMKYAVYMKINGTYDLRENNVFKGSGSYGVGTEFKFERDGDTMKLYVDGTLKHTYAAKIPVDTQYWIGGDYKTDGAKVTKVKIGVNSFASDTDGVNAWSEVTGQDATTVSASGAVNVKEGVTVTSELGAYSEGDVITLTFNKDVSTALALGDISVVGKTLGEGASLVAVDPDGNGYASTFRLILGGGTNLLTQGDAITFAASKVVDASGGTAKANVAFIAPDITPPAASGDAVPDSVDSDSVYETGETLLLNFSEGVRVADLGIGDISLNNGHSLGTGATITAVNAVDGLATQFKLTLGTGTTITWDDVISVSRDAIVDKAGNKPAADQTFDVLAANTTTITEITIADGLYLAGETITVNVKFSDVVDLTTVDPNDRGTMKITLNIGGSEVDATYVAGSGSDTLSFTVEVSGLQDSNGVEVLANSLDSGVIVIKDSQGNEVSTASSEKHFSNVKVDAPFNYGGLYIGNSETDGFLKNNGDAIFAGHKGEGVSTDNITGTGAAQRSDTVWYFDATDAGTQGGEISLGFDLAQLGLDVTGAATNYLLLWRSGQSGDFTTIAVGDAISNGVVTFRDLRVDVNEVNAVVATSTDVIKDGYVTVAVVDDTSTPVLADVSVGANQLELTYSKYLDAASIPAASSFTVTVDGTSRAVTEVKIVGISVVLSFAGDPIAADEVAAVTYVKPTSSPIQDASGHSADSASNVRIGGAGSTDLTGSASADWLLGGYGDDTITGAGGDDLLTGGGGQDTFVYKGSDGNDTITDFKIGAGGDVIDLTELVASAWVPGTSNAANFVQVTEVVGRASARHLAGRRDVIVKVDATGTGNFTNATQIVLEGAGTGKVTLATLQEHNIVFNRAPEDIALSANTLLENANTNANVLVGTLSATDLEGNAISYSLKADVGDNNSFTVFGDKLYWKAGSSLDYEAKTSYSVTVTASDGSGSTDQQVTVDVTNVNEAPVVVDVASKEIGGINLADSGQNVRSLVLQVDGVSAGSDTFTLDGAQFTLSDGASGVTGNNYSYSVSISGGNALVRITKGGDITVSDAEALLNSARYRGELLKDTEANLRLTVQDDGGSANGGQDISAATQLSYKASIFGDARIWLDATDVDGDGDTTDQNANDVVATWADKSGNGNDLTETNADRQASIADNVHNGKQSVYFDGNDFLKAAYVQGKAYSIFTVSSMEGDGSGGAAQSYRLISSANRNWFMGYWNGKEGNFHPEGWKHNPSTAATTDTHIYAATDDGSSNGDALKYYQDGSVSSYTTGGANGIGRLALGGYGVNNGEASKGYVSEVLVFDRALNQTESTIINNYLAQKWGKTLSTDLYDGSLFGDINGIGQASSSDNITDGASTGLKLTESAANGFLKDDGDYAIFAHNGATGIDSADLPAGASGSKLQRIWEMDVTDVNSNEGRVDIAFNQKHAEGDLSGVSGGYALLYRSGATGAFEIRAVSDTPRFDNVKLDGDSADGQYTLARLDTVLAGTDSADTLTGGAGADWLYGAAGDDTLTGGGGIDHFYFSDAQHGSDTITDFTVGSGGDQLVLADLLEGATAGTLGDYLSAVDDGSGNTTLTIDLDGAGTGTASVVVTLQGVSYTAGLVDDLIANNVVL